MLMLSVSSARQQVSSQAIDKPPKEVVNQLWKMATTGELLTRDGWQRAGRLFNHAIPVPTNKTVNVVSNSWGLDNESIKGNTAEVIMGFEDEGTIDATLRYRPPPKTDAVKAGRLYRLVFAPTHEFMYDSDGKTIINRDGRSKGMANRGSPRHALDYCKYRHSLRARDARPDH
jgi:hypothetical protein